MIQIPEILRKVLAARGLEGEALESYLTPRFRDFLPSEALDGVVAAADVILEEVVAHHRIVIFGDYDCDGVSATAILVRTLLALKADVAPFLPERLSEGYGMSAAAVARMLRENPGVALVITVDNGITTNDAVDTLKAQGIRVVITDHHLPNETLPNADVIVNPKVAAPAALSDLCGAGVAFMLARRIMDEARARGLYEGAMMGGVLLILAGLATVTDVMPLVGQNRILVSESLRRFRSWAPMGLKELYSRAARTTGAAITSRDFGFMLGPRINAAGRLRSATQALELLLSDDRAISHESARLVDLLNMERHSIVMAMTEEAQAVVRNEKEARAARHEPPVAGWVIDLPKGHPGVAGIVAARILDQEGVPACIIASGHGSARAPEGFNIRDAFAACESELDRFGGHAAAGGFSVKPGRTEAFRKAFEAYTEAFYREHGLKPGVPSLPHVDLDLEPTDVTLELAESLSRMEPFGEGNEEPVFALRGMTLSAVTVLGSEGRHLSFELKPFGLRAVWWQHGADAERLRAAKQPLDVIFQLGVSDYGERHAELKVISVG